MTHFHPPDIPITTSRHFQPWFLSSFLYISRAQARAEMGQVSAGASEPAAQGLPDQWNGHHLLCPPRYCCQI